MPLENSTCKIVAGNVLIRVVSVNTLIENSALFFPPSPFFVSKSGPVYKFPNNVSIFKDRFLMSLLGPSPNKTNSQLLKGKTWSICKIDDCAPFVEGGYCVSLAYEV